jgi:hypothetical protein
VITRQDDTAEKKYFWSFGDDSLEKDPSLGGKPPQRGTRVGGLLSASGGSGDGAPLTGGEGDRRGLLATEGVGALTRVGPGILHPRERERRALSRCRRRRSNLGGGVWLRGLVAAWRAAFGIAAWWAASRRAAWRVEASTSVAWRAAFGIAA